MRVHDSDPDAIEQAFYAAFGRGDAAAMRHIWAEDARAVCVHPGGPLLHGTAAILQSWAEILSGVAPPEIEHRKIQQLTSGELTVHTVEERIRPANSDQAPTTVIATNVYRLTADGWRMLAHHASLPLVRQGRAGRGPLH